MNNVFCICTTYASYNERIKNWQNKKHKNGDKFVIVDVTKNINFNQNFTFTEQELRNKFNFNIQVSNKNWWNSSNNKNIVWFYAHLRMLNFYIQYPDYDYYWFFDDDITMDNWDLFFDSFNSESADLLTYFMFKNHNVDTQPDVPIIDNKTYSGFEWFKRFPGIDANLPKNINQLFGSFFPTTRFSKKSLETILRYTNDGYHAYHEGMIPTILNYEKQQLKTIIKPDNTSNFFNVNEVNILHKNIRVGWEWI